MKTGNAFFAQGSYKSYKFVGNELQETGFYDMNARFFMPDLGIFGQHDPLSASTFDPYGYAYNNPIMFTDPTGLEGEPIPGGSGPGNPQAIGTVTNPIDVGEVVVNAPIKAIANNSGSILPNNCALCYSGNGTNSGITLSRRYAPPLSADFYKPVLHNGSAQMMDGLLWDVAAIYIANNVKPENKYAAMAVGILAIIISRGHAADDVLKAEASIAKAESKAIVNLTEETFSQALMKGAENVGGYSIYGTKGLVGNTFNRNIFLLEASGSKSLSGFRSLVGNMEKEALGAGANKISIYGSSVINKGFLNPNIAARFGYTFEQLGNGVVLQKTLK